MTQDIDDRDDPDQPVDNRLLNLLVCPVTKGPLEYDEQNNELISHQLGKAFPIRAGVPIMLIDEARDLEIVGKSSDA
tara:strand:+ start:410 stop:640 length:231 start_codon:yes stop_codon:yes gene_type:complete